MVRPVSDPAPRGHPISAATSRSEAIAGRLRDEILRGDYKAGERLPGERDLASRHAAGRPAVREALKTLEQLGLVAIQRGGARVRQIQEASVEIVPHLLFADGELDLEFTGQVLDVHEMLVAGAARLAVERGSDDDLLHACELLRRFPASSASDEARVGLVEELFALITRASGNLVLRLVRNALGPTLRGQVGGLMWGPLRPPEAVLREGIEAIARAIEARDPAATEEATRALLRDRRNRLLQFLRDDSSRELEPRSPARSLAPEEA